MTMPPPTAEAAAHFPLAGSSAGAARRFVATSLEEWGLDELEEIACLLVSELVSNVVLHAGTELDVLLRRSGGQVRVEVHDGSSQMPERKSYSLTSATGRGLIFINELAQDWGVVPTEAGKVVWFELDQLDVPQPPAPVMAAEVNLDDWEDWDDLVPVEGAGEEASGGAATPGGATGALRATRFLTGVP